MYINIKQTLHAEIKVHDGFTFNMMVECADLSEH